MKARWKKIVLMLLITLLIVPAGWAAPVKASTPDTVYHETFENGLQSIPTISGGTVTENVYDKSFSGNDDEAAIYLKERKNSYDGLDFNYADIGLQNGISYNITIKGYVDSDATVPPNSILVLQEVNTSTNAYGPWVSGSNTSLAAGQAFTINAEIMPDTATYAALRLGSNEDGKEVPFYIGDVLITVDPEANTPPTGDFVPRNIANYTFDEGSPQGWGNRGAGRAVLSDEASHSGTHSLKVTDRAGGWHGTEISLSNLLLKDAEYEIKGYAKLVDGQPASNIKFTMIVVNGETTDYQEVTPMTVVTDQEWVELKPSQNFKVGDFTSLTLYAESDNETAAFYLDDITITMVTPPIDLLFDFEDGAQGDWVRRNGSGNIEVTSEDNATEDGQYSLKTTVSEQYDGALLDVVGSLQKGHQYRLSAKVKMAEGQSPATFRISVQYGDSSFANVSQNATVTDQDWVLLTGLYTQSVTPGDVLNVYVEMANSYSGESRTFLVDDFRITYNQAIAGPNPDFTLPAIHEVYADYFPIGNIMNPGDFADNDRLTFLKKHHTLLSAENGMKPEYAYNRNREFDFTNMDALVNNALNNGFDIHGHVLVWHAQSPEWLHTDTTTNTPLPAAEALENLQTHIRTVVEHYGDKMISWDVVNEAVEDSQLSNPEDWKSTLRNSGWLRALGPDFIYESFKAAKDVIDENGWDIDLYYNDYNDDNQRKATAIAAMVSELNEKYAEETGSDDKLIDGIGMQSHYNLNTNVENVKASIERFINIGVKVGVTELDVMAGSGGAQTELQAKAQAYLYAQLFQTYKQYAEHITRVTFWGIDDGTSWRSENAPLIFDSRYQAKAAYHAVIDPEKYIEENKPEEKEYLKSEAKYGTPTIDGEVDDIWNTATELLLNRFQTAHNGATGVAKVLWDEENLYVLVEANDADLDDSSAQAHEQDSVEVFLDENNAKSSSYQADDAQYRVNFNNVATFNPPTAVEGFESIVVVEDSYYRVEMKIPFKTITPANNQNIGFDAQINDASGGERKSVAIWNDYSGAGWQDPSVFGVLTLIGKPGTDPEPSPSPDPGTEPSPSPDPGTEPSPSPDPGTEPSPSPDPGTKPSPSPDPGTPTPTPDPGPGPSNPVNTTPAAPATATITPSVTIQNGVATAAVSAPQFNQALANVGKDNKIIVKIDNQQGASSYAIELPEQALSSATSYTVSVQTALGTIEIPSHALAGQSITGPIKVTIAQVDVSTLPEATRAAIGNRPVISLTLSSTNGVIPYNNPAAALLASIPYAPTAEELANTEQIVIWYIDENGQPSPVANSRYDAASKSVIFSTTHLSDFGVAYSQHQFGDIAHLAWAEREISAMAARGIIKGESATGFNPKADVTRADFIALLVRALELQGSGEVSFSDISSTDYFYNELAIASKNGIISNGSGQFNPRESLTREEMIVLAAKAISVAKKELPAASTKPAFDDEQDISEHARQSVKQLTEAGIIKGRGNDLAPLDTLTRAEAAVILYRIWSL